MTYFHAALAAYRRYNLMPTQPNEVRDSTTLKYGFTLKDLEDYVCSDAFPSHTDLSAIVVEETLKTKIWDAFYCDLYPPGCGYLIFDSALRFSPGVVRIWLLIYSDASCDEPFTEMHANKLLTKYTPRAFIEQLDLLARRRYKVDPQWGECNQYMLNRQAQAKQCAMRMLQAGQNV